MANYYCGSGVMRTHQVMTGEYAGSLCLQHVNLCGPGLYATGEFPRNRCFYPCCALGYPVAHVSLWSKQTLRKHVTLALPPCPLVVSYVFGRHVLFRFAKIGTGWLELSDLKNRHALAAVKEKRQWQREQRPRTSKAHILCSRRKGSLPWDIRYAKGWIR